MLLAVTRIQGRMSVMARGNLGDLMPKQDSDTLQRKHRQGVVDPPRMVYLSRNTGARAESVYNLRSVEDLESRHFTVRHSCLEFSVARPNQYCSCSFWGYSNFINSQNRGEDVEQVNMRAGFFWL